MESENELSLRSRIAARVRRLPFGGVVVRVLRSFFGTGDTEDQWQRIVLNREVRRLIAGIDPGRRKVLEISGTSWPRDGYFAEYRSVDYPEFDVCAAPLGAKFDLVIAEQVFEHVLWPYRAGRNVHQMLESGGYFLITTPFMIKVHECPNDCTRWTETGLRYLLAECGFPLDKIVTGSWGNRACVRANLRWWQIYQPWRHSLRNDPEFPVQVWALAQRS